ncbi:hypothetical protein BCR32DRAFT_277800 [Anaeromyces robustus]|uniref:Uncharacterized protein n=1 Tax=Anaeromyces robustus TaxID=1754192 RepID=A0A1Y1V689_9FUNG|nr:hypothetical protein BCR32DRAFT_288204 [Anaeromyces robustus]ORX83720.1 hypothetical protein BCR32DRAFT_277800 [Anaeromyces robustus]|eukprot:ORX48329.1 hypothetical protein BCR32DRAFT_288204 [Anaeromyces robustus]
MENHHHLIYDNNETKKKKNYFFISNVTTFPIYKIFVTSITKDNNNNEIKSILKDENIIIIGMENHHPLIYDNNERMENHHHLIYDNNERMENHHHLIYDNNESL